jgi:DNA-binding transcriptional ArsR family regulator
MTDPDALGENEARLLKALFEETGGDPSAQVSMYELGEPLGMDRPTVSHAAEELMSEGLVDIRTLAGAIGLTEAGRDQMAGAAEGDGESSDGMALGDAPVLDTDRRGRVETEVAAIKAGTGELGLSFDALSELAADLRTVDAQLASPRPKTAIVRECFRSIGETLAGADAAGPEARVRALLGESAGGQ